MSPILCIGAAHWDIIARTDLPLAPGDDVPGRIFRRPGGVALNVAIALAAEYTQVHLRAVVGQDAPGISLIAAAEARGVNCDRVIRTAAPTDSYLAIETGGRLFGAVADCGSHEAAGERILADLPPGPLLLDGNLPAPVFLHPALAGRAIVLVAVTPTKAARLSPAIAGRTVYANRAEAEAIVGHLVLDAEAGARALLAHGAVEAVVTDGGRAASDGTVTLQPPAVPVHNPTGAGDTFLAAHLAARMRGEAPAAAMTAALAAAARHLGRAA